MHKDREDVFPGTLQMLILSTLLRGPLHGYAIAKEIQRRSEDQLQVEEGSLYPALQRLLRKGFVTAEWVSAGPKRRARVYKLTPVGRKEVAIEVDSFTGLIRATLRVIRST
jgi:transcriptional regulator